MKKQQTKRPLDLTVIAIMQIVMCGFMLLISNTFSYYNYICNNFMGNK